MTFFDPADWVFSNTNWELDAAIKKINLKSIHFKTGSSCKACWIKPDAVDIHEGRLRSWVRWKYDGMDSNYNSLIVSDYLTSLSSGYRLQLYGNADKQSGARLYRSGIQIFDSGIIAELTDELWFQMQMRFWLNETVLCIACEYCIDGSTWIPYFVEYTDSSPLYQDYDVYMGIANWGAGQCWFDYSEAYKKD